jgi:hypothetical protein
LAKPQDPQFLEFATEIVGTNELCPLTPSPTSAYGCRARRWKDGDSYCQTATSRRENVVGRIDVAMVVRTALKTKKTEPH